jgi:hypothetical protein
MNSWHVKINEIITEATFDSRMPRTPIDGRGTPEQIAKAYDLYAKTDWAYHYVYILLNTGMKKDNLIFYITHMKDNLVHEMNRLADNVVSVTNNYQQNIREFRGFIKRLAEMGIVFDWLDFTKAVDNRRTEIIEKIIIHAMHTASISVYDCY